ncbi:MAG: helix-turn-helix domain-containing protein [Candidatus Caldarchaeales archaeon]
MSLLEELRGNLHVLFSEIELEVLDYLSRHPWGATVYEIAKSINRSSKTLYTILKILQKNGWVIIVREKNGSIGRPKNKYVLRCGLSTITKELEDCECKVNSSHTKFLNLSEIAYPYSLTIFKRYLTTLSYGECLVILLRDDNDCKPFIETADKKNVKLMKIKFDSPYIQMIFKKTWT